MHTATGKLLDDWQKAPESGHYCIGDRPESDTLHARSAAGADGFCR